MQQACDVRPTVVVLYMPIIRRFMCIRKRLLHTFCYLSGVRADRWTTRRVQAIKQSVIYVYVRTCLDKAVIYETICDLGF